MEYALLALALFALGAASGGLGFAAGQSRKNAARRVSDLTRQQVLDHRHDVELATAGTPDVSPALLFALIAKESAGNPTAVGDDGTAFGLTQITEATWQDYYAATNDIEAVPFPDVLLDPRIACRIGAWTLQDRISRRSESDRVFHGLRAYNCGTVGASQHPTCGVAYASWILDAAQEFRRAIA